MIISRPKLQFRTRQVINKDVVIAPLVGFESLNDKPNGFRFDIKRWSSPFDLRLPTFPRLSDMEPQGVSASEYFLPGVGSIQNGDLEVLDIHSKDIEESLYWVPFIRSGYYYNYNKQFFYFGDNSRVQYVDPDENRDSRNFINLEEEPDINYPIIAATYKRNPITWAIDYNIKIDRVAEFSGIYVDGVEQPTVDQYYNINWDNIDITKKEFILDNGISSEHYLKFNRDFTKQYGVIPVVEQDLAACIFLGYSNGTPFQVYHLVHFPVVPDDFHLYVTTNSGFEEWTRAESWFDLIVTKSQVSSKRYYLDKDLGIIYFGSAIENSLPPLGSSIVCSYKTTLRVEYEELETNKTINALKANVNPISQYTNQGFVCITHQDLSPAKIKLEIDKQAIPGTANPKIFGPITVGADYALLKATVTTYDDVPSPGVEVSFIMNPSNCGYLNYASSSIAVTNNKGEAFVPYQPPTSADDLGYYVTNTATQTMVEESGGIVTITIPDQKADLLGQEDQTYIYQILKDDLILGYDDVDTWIDTNLVAPPWVRNESDRAEWKAEVKAEYNLKDWFEVNTASGVQASGAIAGRKVVLYTIDKDTNAIDPVSGENGAYVPLRPTSIVKVNGFTKLTYPAAAIQEPDPDPRAQRIIGSDGTVFNNVAGYWIVSTKNIRFQAFCWSPRYNRDIYSNTIIARVSLPNYLLGEYINDQLKKIPYGWKLFSDIDNNAAGLNGATFLTINPCLGPYKIIDLVTETVPEDWASAPFKSVAFQVNVEEN